MISSIFGKTKPINFIILLGFIFLVYWCVQFYLLENEFSTDTILLKSVVLSTLLFSVFVIDFIVKRNKITGPNTFSILFYALLLIVFPETLGDNNVILCTFFLLLATRRLLSIKSLKDIKSKIFDATLWILISSLFYDWAIIYLILVFAAIYIYDPKNIRNWMVVMAATFCYFIILLGVLILIDKTSFLNSHYSFTITYDRFYWPNWGSSIRLLLYIILNGILALWAFLKLGKAGVGKITVIRIIALSFILGLIVNILVVSDSSYALMITFFPSVIFITNYIETIKRSNILEAVLMISIFLPLVVFISRLALK